MAATVDAPEGPQESDASGARWTRWRASHLHIGLRARVDYCARARGRRRRLRRQAVFRRGTHRAGRSGASKPRRGGALRAGRVVHRLRAARGLHGQPDRGDDRHRVRTAAHPLGERGKGGGIRRPAAPGPGEERGCGRAGVTQLREEAPPKTWRRPRTAPFIRNVRGVVYRMP